MCCRVTAGRPLAGPLRWRPAGCQQVDSPARVVACDRTGSATLPQWVRIHPWLGQGAPTGPPRVRVGGAPTLLHPRDSLRVLSGREKRGGQVGRWRGRWQFVTVSLLSLVIAVRPPHPPPRPSPSALSFSGSRGGFSGRVSRGGDTGGEEIQTVRRYRRWSQVSPYWAAAAVAVAARGARRRRRGCPSASTRVPLEGPPISTAGSGAGGAATTPRGHELDLSFCTASGGREGLSLATRWAQRCRSCNCCPSGAAPQGSLSEHPQRGPPP